MPLSTMATVRQTVGPLSVGALLTLVLFRLALDFYGFIGIVLLIGIVKKNAIVMIDFALEAQREGRAPEVAIQEAALVRSRPIMMTTLRARTP